MARLSVSFGPCWLEVRTISGRLSPLRSPIATAAAVIEVAVGEDVEVARVAQAIGEVDPV